MSHHDKWHCNYCSVLGFSPGKQNTEKCHRLINALVLALSFAQERTMHIFFRSSLYFQVTENVETLSRAVFSKVHMNTTGKLCIPLSVILEGSKTKFFLFYSVFRAGQT